MEQPGAQPETLVGRLPEADSLRQFVHRARTDGGALLVSGDPGVGKTALLDATAETARSSGTTVLRVTGTEFEAEVSHAGLHQALLPLVDHLAGLGDEQAAAVRVALGFETGPAPDRLLLCGAVTMLLRTTAARTPLLLVLDDVPWLDRAGAVVLSFAARRLAGSRTGLLAAFRTGSPGYFDVSGLPELTVRPLDDEAAGHLLTERFPGLDPQTRVRVLDTAQGNPLALLELPQALEETRRGPTRSLPRVLPLGQRLQRLFASRVAALAAACAAVVAPDEAAAKLFEQALTLPTADAWPFDTARIRLLYGERLRRSRAATEARVQLRLAHTAFQKLGAVPWAARAERELRAAGEATRTAADARGVATLTPQELEIARLAASGLSNKQIAERLYVSPRTVSTHLYQIFPKLGITRRAALRDAIGGDEA
ncbi:hypothetical protein ACZ91_14980 [Streptomyces regensis]|nr:hypothetical protein ACZ91_14980 [Streptomyces regensis]